MSQQCSWPTHSWPLEGRWPYYALLGLTQAPGFAGGHDYLERKKGFAVQLCYLFRNILAFVFLVLKLIVVRVGADLCALLGLDKLDVGEGSAAAQGRQQQDQH